MSYQKDVKIHEWAKRLKVKMKDGYVMFNIWYHDEKMELWCNLLFQGREDAIPAYSKCLELCLATIKKAGYKVAIAFNGNVAIKKDDSYHEFTSAIDALKYLAGVK